MSKPLVIAYHLIWTVYGTWLPNDPRGSGSTQVDSPALRPLGEAHLGRKRVQPPSREIGAFYKSAANKLQHNVELIDPEVSAVILQAFAEACEVHRYTCWACAILPDHVHMVIRKHRDTAEKMTDHLRCTAKHALAQTGRWPADHPVWSGGHGWRVFLDHPDAVRRTIRYVEENPPRLQRWPFVKTYDGWPLHPGHSPSSPYVKALKAVGRYTP